MNATYCDYTAYENTHPFGAQKNKANQSQFVSCTAENAEFAELFDSTQHLDARVWLNYNARRCFGGTFEYSCIC